MSSPPVLAQELTTVATPGLWAVTIGADGFSYTRPDEQRTSLFSPAPVRTW